MKSKFFIHLGFAIALFVFVTVFKQWFSLEFAPFWIGGLVGVFLPDVDHLIYVYVLRPHELTSQRATRMIIRQELSSAAGLLASTTPERKGLIFHSALFQQVFNLFAFFVVTSTGSHLGRGIVLAFLLHLLVDQLVDLMERDNIDGWFMQIRVAMDKQKATLYWVANLVLLLIFAFVL